MPKSKMPNARVVLRNLRRDADTLVERGRTEVLKDVRAVRRSAERTVRDLERKVVRQFHAATEEQLKQLERRVGKLERAINQRIEKLANVA